MEIVRTALVALVKANAPGLGEQELARVAAALGARGTQRSFVGALAEFGLLETGEDGDLNGFLKRSSSGRVMGLNMDAIQASVAASDARRIAEAEQFATEDEEELADVQRSLETSRRIMEERVVALSAGSGGGLGFGAGEGRPVTGGVTGEGAGEEARGEQQAKEAQKVTVRAGGTGRGAEGEARPGQAGQQVEESGKRPGQAADGLGGGGYRDSVEERERDWRRCSPEQFMWLVSAGADWDVRSAVIPVLEQGCLGQGERSLLWAARRRGAASALAAAMLGDEGRPSVAAAKRVGALELSPLAVVMVVHALQGAGEDRLGDSRRSLSPAAFRESPWTDGGREEDFRRATPARGDERARGSRAVTSVPWQQSARVEESMRIGEGPGEEREAPRMYSLLAEEARMRGGANDLRRIGLSPMRLADCSQDVARRIICKAATADHETRTNGAPPRDTVVRSASVMMASLNRQREGAYECGVEGLPRLLLAVQAKSAKGVIRSSEVARWERRASESDDSEDDGEGVAARRRKPARRRVEAFMIQDDTAGSFASPREVGQIASQAYYKHPPNLDAAQLVAHRVTVGLLADRPELLVTALVLSREFYDCARRIDISMRGSGVTAPHRAFAMEVFFQATRELGGASADDTGRPGGYWSSRALASPAEFARVLTEQLPVFFAMPGVTDDAKAPGGARVVFDAKEAIASKALRRRLTRVGIAFAGVTIMPEARIARGGAAGADSALKAELTQQRKATAEREKALRAVRKDLEVAKRQLAAARAAAAGKR
jgi:hypothetical protein